MSEDVAGAQISDGTLAGGPSRTATNSPPLISENTLRLLTGSYWTSMHLILRPISQWARPMPTNSLADMS